MILTRDNLYARVTEATAAERTWLGLALRYHSKSGHYSGKEHGSLLDPINERFPAGMLPELCARAPGEEITLRLVDERGPPLVPDPDAPLGWLDAMQREALAVAIRYQRGILHLPTGSGKTELYLALALSFPGERVLVCAPNAQLVAQAAARWALRTEGAPCGVLAEGERTFHRVTFATYQTLHAGVTRGDAQVRALLHGTRVLIADEAHTGAAQTWFPVLMATPNARVRIGGSATPLDRTDDRAVYVVGALGPVVHAVGAQALVATGRLVPARVTLHRLKQFCVAADPRDLAVGRACPGCGALGAEPCSGGCDGGSVGSWWQRAYDELVVRSPVRNALVLELVRDAPKPALVFVRALEHARALKTSIRGSRVVTGSCSVKQRAQAVTDLRRGELDVVITNRVWEAGVDVPELRSVVNAGAGASDIRTVQMLGRVLRGAEGKDGAAMLDVLDEGEPVLARHARRRRAAYEREGFEVVVVGAR